MCLYLGHLVGLEVQHSLVDLEVLGEQQLMIHLKT